MTNFFIPIIVFMFGAIFGSFINVLGLRWPEKQTINGRSHCPRCQTKLTWWQMFPILSFMLLRGRCHKCHQEISVQYPLVELSSGIITLILFTPLPVHSFTLISTVITTIILYNLLVLAIVDLKTMLLPDNHIIVVSILVIISLLLNKQLSLNSILLGALIGAGSLGLIWLATRGRGIGLGDVKLLIPLGALLGPQQVVVMLWLAFIIGGICGIWLLSQRQATLKTAIPFGPFIIGATILVILSPGLFSNLLPL